MSEKSDKDLYEYIKILVNLQKMTDDPVEKVFALENIRINALPIKKETKNALMLKHSVYSIKQLFEYIPDFVSPEVDKIKRVIRKLIREYYIPKYKEDLND